MVLMLLEGEQVAVVDPGTVASRDMILAPMTSIGVGPERVTNVVVSHHHLDHTLHGALFEHA